MRKLLFLFLITLVLGCDDSNFNNRNPYLPNYRFTIDININLPAYSNLQFPSNWVKIYSNDGPTNGIILFNTGSTIIAFDGSCPNQEISSCSSLTLSGIEATCPCDNAVYLLLTGQSQGQPYPLKQYRVEVNGNIIRVFN